jgi:hypothetical protein
MSLAQFDEIFDICCEYMALDETDRTDKAKNDRLEVSHDAHHIGNKWWENAACEIEKEKELQHV